MSNKLSTLIQVAVLAGALVPLSALSAEATVISCLFTASGGSSDVCDSSDEGGSGFRFGASAIYEFNGGAFSEGGYEVELHFGAGDILGDFFVAFENEELSQDSPVWEERLANFPNHICVPIAGPDSGPGLCVFLRATTDAPLPNGPSDPGPDTWNVDDRYDLFVRWNADTRALHGDNPHLLHANISCGPGDTGCGDDVFDRDITNPETYTACPPDCGETGIDLFKVAGDPGVGGDDDNFGGFTITAVPEPGTVFLLVTGIAGLAYRKRSGRPRPE